MNRKVIKVLDTHTEGMPTRVVLSGAPDFVGLTMNDKRIDFENRFDDFRKLLVNEPRGHAAMSGAILLTPTLQEADFGVLYFEVSGCLPMCIHGTIGVATAIVAEKLMQVSYPETLIKLDTPAGLVEARVKVDENLEPLSVTVKNVESFYINQGVVKHEGRDIGYELSYGGNLYAIVDCNDLGIELESSSSEDLVKIGLGLIDIIENEMVIPLREELKSYLLRHIILAEYGGGVNFKGATVIKPGWIDRSPCGTGTSAHLVARAHKGFIEVGELVTSTSFIGSEFFGLLENGSKPGNYFPHITGRAWVMGKNEIYLYPSDIFPTGFIL
jgi:proline racemase